MLILFTVKRTDVQIALLGLALTAQGEPFRIDVKLRETRRRASERSVLA